MNPYNNSNLYKSNIENENKNKNNSNPSNSQNKNGNKNNNNLSKPQEEKELWPNNSNLPRIGKSICIYSYNSRGFAQEKQDVCKILMSNSGSSYSVLCNQENFLLRGNGYKIKQCLTDAHVIIKSAINNSHDNGRPKNGMFIAVPAKIKEYVSDVSTN